MSIKICGRLFALLTLLLALGACVDESTSGPTSTSTSTQEVDFGPQPDEGACNSDCHCDYGQVCIDGACSPDFGPFPPCYCAARDCGDGEVCSGGFCEAGGGGGGGGGGGSIDER